MGSYNYEALHKHTPGIKRTWSGDPVAPNRGGYNNGNNIRTVDQPYGNGYGNQLQDRLLLAQAQVQAQAQLQAQVQAQAQAHAQLQAQAHLQAQAQARTQPYGGLNEVTHYGLTKYSAPAPVGITPSDYLMDVDERDRYGDVYANGLPIRRPIRDPLREPLRDPLREPLREPIRDLIREPIRDLIREPIRDLIREPMRDPIRELNREPIREPIREFVREPPLTRELPLIREPLRQRARRERRVREPVIREPLRDPIRDLERSLSSLSPSPPPRAADGADEPPLAGMIFGCTSDTYIECMQLKLFALPAANKSEVMRVAPGTKLFLYNYRERELSGIFEATSYGDMNIMPDAFRGFFPAQVRIQCVEKCPNLPLKAFKEAMSENFEKKKNKFKYSLDEVQVRKLVTLFRQEAKYWQKEREKQQYKILSSGLQPGLRPGYPTRNEVNLARQLPNEPASFIPTPKWARMF